MNELVLIQAPPADVPGLLMSLVALVIPAAATWLAMEAAKLSSFVAGLGDMLKRGIALVLAFAVAFVQSHVPGLPQLPVDLAGFDATVFAGLLNFAASQVAFLLFKKPAA